VVVPALALSLALGALSPAGPAAADPDAGSATLPVPSKAAVDAARQRVGRTAQAVGAIQAALASANQRLVDASVVAEQAAEAYNGARWRLHQANLRLADARSADRAARRSVVAQRAGVAGLVVGSYESAGHLDTVEALLADSGPAGVMSRYLTAQGAEEQVDADLQRFTASSAVAEVFADQAEAAQRRQARLADQAREAQEQAAAAAQAAQTAAVQIDAERTRLVAELARAQGVSLRLARQRQAALEQRARRADEARRARELARQQAEAQAEPQAEPQAEAAARDQSPASAEPPTAAPPAQQNEGRTDQSEPQPPPLDPVVAPPPPPAPAPPPAPTPVATPAPVRGGAARAIAFARAQLGEPYVWGGSGPSSWDCSGLTMRAWQSAGVSLPHYSVAQYYATTPISSGSLRPGDLVFWGTSSSPSSIHHVAMYLGDGLIIHAPRTGRPVSIDSMYYWVPPNFFGRV
jgi:cell wall-associated NlpC family hydrolase